MASQFFPSLESAHTKLGMHVVTSQARTAELLTLEYPADGVEDSQGNLGCVRGIVWALGIQAVFVLAIGGLWELFRVVH